MHRRCLQQKHRHLCQLPRQTTKEQNHTPTIKQQLHQYYPSLRQPLHRRAKLLHQRQQTTKLQRQPKQQPQPSQRPRHNKRPSTRHHHYLQRPMRPSRSNPTRSQNQQLRQYQTRTTNRSQPLRPRQPHQNLQPTPTQGQLQQFRRQRQQLQQLIKQFLLGAGGNITTEGSRRRLFCYSSDSTTSDAIAPSTTGTQTDTYTEPKQYALFSVRTIDAPYELIASVTESTPSNDARI